MPEETLPARSEMVPVGAIEVRQPLRRPWAAFIARVRYLVDARHGLYPAFEREDEPGSVPTLKIFAHLREKEPTP